MPTIEMIPVDLIDPHPHNPRWDLGQLEELAESIKAQGIQQNLLLVPNPDAPDRYRAVIGHRRLAASKLVGLTEVPAIVNPRLTDSEQHYLMLLENCQRQDLSPVEEAAGYQDLLDLGVGVRQIAAKTGRNEKTVTARLRLMKLPDAAREKVHLHQATLEDAAEMDRFVGYPELLAKLTDAIGTNNWRWRLDDAKRELRVDELRKSISVELRKLGIKHHTHDGYAYAEYRPVARITSTGDLARAKKDGIPEGTVYINNYSGIELIRPTTDDERAESSSQDTERDAHWEALEAEAVAAAKLRDDFIRDLMTKTLTPKQISIILSGALLNVVATHMSDGWLIEKWAGVGRSPARELPAELRAAFPDADPACWLLVVLHGRVQPDRWTWQSISANPDAQALYSVLEQLGYQLSDMERARLQPEPEPTPTCRVCGCTDDHACVTDGVPCSWVEDDLCSACSVAAQ